MSYLAAWRIRSFELPNTELFSAQILFALTLLFGVWTVVCHVSTFAGVPWALVVNISALLALPMFILCLLCVLPLSKAYLTQSGETAPWLGLQDVYTFGAMVLTASLLFVFPSFNAKFVICLFGMAICFFLSRRQPGAQPRVTTRTYGANRYWISYGALAGLIALAVAITLFNHRPDFDDASYIQTAIQTLAHPHRAPLDYDSSLGDIVNVFRFAPYRLDSYELLVALLSSWTGADVLHVYYVVLPAISAACCVMCAYLFSRWFLPNHVALLCVFVFLILLLSWGETHWAYGNRVFVRMYQGKALLIGLTTPLTLVAGLVFLRNPKLSTWLPLVFFQIAALGASSTGLVITLVVTAILMVVAIEPGGAKKVVANMACIAASAFYPVLCGLWLKFSHNAVPDMAEIGSSLPINASLGEAGRQAMALTIFIVGIATTRNFKSHREFRLLALAVLVIALDPWLANLTAAITAKNMHWRIAWAAPVPLILAIVLTANLAAFAYARPRPTYFPIATSVLAAAFLGCFILISRSALSTHNNVDWRTPGPTVPPEYSQADAVAKIIRPLNVAGRVLAYAPIGTWLTVTEPGLRLVMPGHGFPMNWKTVLMPEDFSDRMKLLSAVSGAPIENLSETSRLMAQYNVEIIVAPTNAVSTSLIDYLDQHHMPFEEIAHIPGFAIYRGFQNR